MPMVPKSDRTERASRARLLGQKIKNKWLDKMVGKRVFVLVEQNGMGFTENYLPVRVDKKVQSNTIIQAIVKGKVKDELVI